MAVFVSVFVVLGLAFHKNLTSVQKNSEFDLRDVLWRDILTVLSFKFVFSLDVEKNIQNVQNMQKQENSGERTNLTIKDHGIWKIKVTTPILNWR